MTDPLTLLLADGVVDEVIGRLKTGKEADVWLVRHAGEILAAKVYREREARSFRNNAAYTEGRRVRDTRTQRAIQRGSRFGRAADEGAWKTREADVLHTLHAAGVRVPRPHVFYEGVLVMELVVDASGHPAPRLIDASVPHGAAAELYRDLRRQIVAMLCCDLVHADLSPYNVLLGRAGPVIIDFPQVVGAAHNNQAERFLRRDLENLRQFFAQHDRALHAAAGDAAAIWRAYVHRELTPDFVPPVRGPAAPPRTTAPHHPARHRGGREEGGRRAHPAAGASARPAHAQPGTTGRAPHRPGRPAGQPRREERQPEVIRIVRGSAPHAGAPSTPHPPKHPTPGSGPGPAATGSSPAGASHSGRRRRRRRGRR